MRSFIFGYGNSGGGGNPPPPLPIGSKVGSTALNLIGTNVCGGTNWVIMTSQLFLEQNVRNWINSLTADVPIVTTNYIVREGSLSIPANGWYILGSNHSLPKIQLSSGSIVSIRIC